MQKKRKIDWTKLKLEYISSDKSIRSILDREKIGQCKTTNKYTKGWVEERKEVQRRIVEKAKTQIVNANVKQWENQTKLWKAVEGQAAKILQKHIESDKPLEPKELASLTIAIEKALKGQKLIIGEPTERIEERSIILEVIKIIEEAEKD